jgi:hypothetical protein
MEPKGIECFILANSIELRFPFSKPLFTQLESLKTLVAEDTSRLEEDENNLDKAGNLTQEVLDGQLERFRNLADLALDPKVLKVMKKYH